MSREVQDATDPTAATAKPWLSMHLHFRGQMFGAAADQVLLQDVAPWLDSWRDEGLVGRFFFIRYELGGPHIRLRILPRESARNDELERRLLEMASASPRIETARVQPYEPELARYGGPAGLGPSEAHFQASSLSALQLLKKIGPDDRPARLGKAMLAQLVLLHGLLPDRRQASALIRAFGSSYLRHRAGDAQRQQQWLGEFERGFDRQSDRLAAYVEAAWNALEERDPLTPELDTLRDSLVVTRCELRKAADQGRLLTDEGPGDWPSCVAWLLPSYLHMTHNRLGANLREECYLAVLIEKTLLPEAVSETAFTS